MIGANGVDGRRPVERRVDCTFRCMFDYICLRGVLERSWDAVILDAI